MYTGPLLLLLGNFIGGAFTPFFVKLGTQSISPIPFTFLRFFVASIIFLPFMLRNREKLSQQDLKRLIIQAIFLTINATLFAIGIQYTSILISQILYTFVPIIVGIIAWLFLNETFTKEKIIGGCIAFIGVIFLLAQSVKNPSENIYGTLVGNIFVLIAVFSWSIYIILSKKLTQRHTATTVSFFGFVITAGILFLATLIDLFVFGETVGTFSQAGGISVLGVGVVSVIMIALLQIGTQKTTAFTASLFLYLGPFFSSITAIPFFHERVTTNLIIGGILILAGVFYATTYAQMKKHKRRVVQYIYAKKKKKH